MAVYDNWCQCFGGYLASYFTVAVEPNISPTEVEK